MDKTQLMELLIESDIHSVKPRTQLSSYADATYANMTAAQVNNRSSATWKIAQFIIVDDCQPENRGILLSKWRELTGSYTGQYLLVYNSATQRYDIYDCRGLFMFDDTSIGKLINLDVGTVHYAPGEGINKIFYGVPGCGKSHHIQHNILETNGYAKKNVIRTTFYQDYSNADFVGQILPKITKNANGEDVVEYIFNPGPFTLALIQAIKYPASKVALVVEEINRGNAPAIFGDIFQLLDRDDSGISEYGIKNVNVTDYLETINFGTDSEPIHYTFNDIKIPGNLHIFATMNTSDQNVYTLDTAFTRRWAKERIENDFNGSSIETMRVPGMTDVTWGAFVTAVNDRIRAKLDELQVNEDKQIGAFFVKKADLLTAEEVATCNEKKIRLFAYKVLEYLWDDVSKLDHTQLFNPAYTSFEKLVKDYVSNGSAVFNGEITFAKVAASESAS